MSPSDLNEVRKIVREETVKVLRMLGKTTGDDYVSEADLRLVANDIELEQQAEPAPNPCNKCWRVPHGHELLFTSDWTVHHQCGGCVTNASVNGWNAANPLPSKPVERRFKRNTRLRSNVRRQTIRIIRFNGGEFRAIDDDTGHLFSVGHNPESNDVSLSELAFSPEGWTPIDEVPNACP